jgi:hypothetical protein
MSRARRLRSSRIALRRSSARFCDAPPRSFGRVGHADSDPAEILSRQQHRGRDGGQIAVRGVELAHGLRNPRIVGTILDRRHPAWLVLEQMLRLRLGLANRGILRQVSGGDDGSAEMRHPELAARPLVVEQPHTRDLALGLFGQRLEQGAEEPVEIRLAHEQIE